MMRGITDLGTALSAVLPPWMMAALGVVAAVAALPLFVERSRQKQIRGAIRRLVRADPPTRDALLRWVQTLSADRERRLTLVAEEATKREQWDLRQWALEGLERSETGRREAARLRKARTPEPKPFNHPLEAEAMARTLAAAGARVAARDVVRRARRRFPDSPELGLLEAELEEAG
jgi:hypothetical protein